MGLSLLDAVLIPKDKTGREGRHGAFRDTGTLLEPQSGGGGKLFGSVGVGDRNIAFHSVNPSKVARWGWRSLAISCYLKAADQTRYRPARPPRCWRVFSF